MRWFFYSLKVSAFLFISSLIHKGQTSPFFPNHCGDYVTQYEKEHGIPSGLLQAISKVESGRKDHTGRFIAWPWTVNAEGQSYYFSTKEEAIEAVRELQFKGHKSIDVGCMQINLYYHPYAFKSLEDAFDPAQNVAYAASFLTKLRNEHASWYMAISHYHSANPLHHLVYRKNVLNMWDQDNKEGHILLAGDMVKENISSFPKVNRLRRLSTSRKAKLTPPMVLAQSSSKPAVRRITRASRHLRRPATKALALNP